MSSKATKSSLSLENFSLQPCIDKLSNAVLCDQKQLKKFSEATSRQEQVRVLLQTFSHKPQVTIREAVYEIVNELSRYGDVEEGKSEQLAEEYKQQGSKAFSQHDDITALRLYNKALKLCPHLSANLPLLYANRSAVLYHMARYQESLKDITRAMDHQYPSKLRHKVLLRKAQCLQRLGQTVEATATVKETMILTQTLGDKMKQTYIASLDEVQQALSKVELDDQCEQKNVDATKAQRAGQVNSQCEEKHDKDAPDIQARQYQHTTNEELASSKRQKDGQSSHGSKAKDELLFGKKDFLKRSTEHNLIDGPNKSINYMSSALELRINEAEGRHIISKRCLSRGSTVFVERPFASILLPQYHSAYCYNCISCLSSSPVPCTGCRVVLFCSEQCRNTSSYWHRLDCCRLTLTAAGGMAQLSLRAVMVAGWSVCSTVMQESEASSSKSGSNRSAEDKQYNGFSRLSKYRALYNLVEHIDQMPVEEQIQYCIAAIILATTMQNKLDSLSRRNYDNKKSKGRMAESWGSLQEIAGLLYRHIGQFVCNGYAIYQIVPQRDSHHTSEGSEGAYASSSGIESLSQERLASAIYATASLMNHSCKPSTINSFVGNLLVIRTIEDVKAGERVYSCYGPHFCRHHRSERLSLLQEQYRFTCLCEPCTQDHYLLKEHSWCGLKCESCGGVATFDDTEADDADNRSGRDNTHTAASHGDEASMILTCHECGQVKPSSQRLRKLCIKAQELHKLGEATMKMESGNLQQAAQDLEEAIKTGEMVYCYHNQFLSTIHDTYAMVLAAQGFYRESARVVNRFLKTAERRYGYGSVEMGHELVKYHRILLEQQRDQASSKLSLEMKDIESRIASIFTTCYGAKWKDILNVHL